MESEQCPVEPQIDFIPDVYGIYPVSPAVINSYLMLSWASCGLGTPAVWSQPCYLVSGDSIMFFFKLLNQAL